MYKRQRLLRAVCRQAEKKEMYGVNMENFLCLGDENASEPLVLGNELARLMLDFLTECSKIMTRCV